MIQLISGSIEIPASTFNGVWIQSIQVNAPSPTKPIMATIKVCPFNSETGDMANNMFKTISIDDVESTSIETPSLGTAMSAIFVAVQDLMTSGSITF